MDAPTGCVWTWLQDPGRTPTQQVMKERRIDEGEYFTAVLCLNGGLWECSHIIFMKISNIIQAQGIMHGI